jgi:hypothetical protein
MGLGAVNAAPCAHGGRTARIAVDKRPQEAACANPRRHYVPLRAPYRVGTTHYAAQRTRAASGARRALRRACSGKMGGYPGYINPRVLAVFRHRAAVLGGTPRTQGADYGRRALRMDAGRPVRAPGATAGSSSRRCACWQHARRKALRFGPEDLFRCFCSI